MQPPTPSASFEPVTQRARRARVKKLGRLLALSLALLLACNGDDNDPAADGGHPAADGGSSTCSGKPGMLRGKSTQMVTVGAAQRSFVYYAPDGLDPNQAVPVVLVAHGFMMNAEMMYEITRYSALADTEKFVVLFLDGASAAGPWNVGMPDCQSSLGPLPLGTGDDQGFVDAALKLVEADRCIDREHVFMTGFSMGGYFSNETGCLRDEIRAVAPHSGGTHDLASCPSKKKPVLVMHFDGDALIPYACGEKARDRWVERNGCSLDAPEVKSVTGGSCAYYKGCPQGAQVAFCTFMNPPGMRSEPFVGHAWSGGSKEGTSGGASFAIPETASASQLSWEFFKKYAW